nr:FAD-dependent oxidoreductase [uncultured Desulfuromonas sp.]
MKVAIVGAGMAGLTAAHILDSHGIDVTVFEKSKGTGGRMSSRSFAGGWIDHGTPYFSAETVGFQSFLKKFADKKIIEPWAARVNGPLALDEIVHYISVPRTSAFTRALLADIKFHPSTHISMIEKTGSMWRIYNDGRTDLGLWDLVILAIPSPQAVQLLVDQKDIRAKVEGVEMEPCWVCALQLPGPAQHIQDVTVFTDNDIRRVTCNSAKKDRANQHVYIVQASAAWSEKHLEEPPAVIGNQLKQKFLGTFNLNFECDVLFSHRWRYGFTTTPLAQPYLWDDQQLLGVCGDWCLGRRVEDAWKSGSELGKTILSSLKTGGPSCMSIL